MDYYTLNITATEIVGMFISLKAETFHFYVHRMKNKIIASKIAMDRKWCNSVQYTNKMTWCFNWLCNKLTQKSALIVGQQ